MNHAKIPRRIKLKFKTHIHSHTKSNITHNKLSTALKILQFQQTENFQNKTLHELAQTTISPSDIILSLKISAGITTTQKKLTYFRENVQNRHNTQVRRFSFPAFFVGHASVDTRHGRPKCNFRQPVYLRRCAHTYDQSRTCVRFERTCLLLRLATCGFWFFIAFLRREIS